MWSCGSLRSDYIADETATFVILKVVKKLLIHLVRFIFLTFTLCSFYLVCSPVRWALTFVGCDKSKQKHAFTNQSAGR